MTLLVVLGAQTATVISVLIAANRDFDIRADANLREGSRILTKLRENRAYILRQLILPMSVDEEFLAAVRSQDKGLISEELRKHAAWIDADIAILTDHEGNMVATTGASLPQINDLSNLEKAEHTTISINKDYYEMVSVPQGGENTSDQNPVGRLSMGFLLDDSLAQSFASVAGLEMTLMVLHQPDKNAPLETLLLGSSLPHDTRKLIRDISEKIMRGLDYAGAGEMISSTYLSAGVPYLPKRPDLIAILQVPTTEAMEPFAVLRGTLIQAAATAILGELTKLVVGLYFELVVVVADLHSARS